ncbi:MAG: hypothetical protein [Wendovervirus sonii]|uniref:Uncharacterized protein n=1 Tax=phage Lak_Megaphage_Sonny TaxID=3109229 RepID=A0ABZ0Z3P2_9CAUD|nr:MAG: hypothetical protein [phage Lak_Megaphage_Sonny]
MEKAIDLLKDHAIAITMHNDALKAEMNTCTSILKDYVTKTYIGKFVETKTAYYFIKSIEEIEPERRNDDMYYRVWLCVDLYQKYQYINGVFIRYKDCNNGLSFDINGNPINHTIMPDDFNMSDFCIIDGKDKSVLYDHYGEPLTVGDDVFIPNNYSFIDGVVIGFDKESKKIKVKISGDERDSINVDGSCLINHPVRL